MENWHAHVIDEEGKLYLRGTANLENRIRQHGVTTPLSFEGPLSKAEVLKRERNLKAWRREMCLLSERIRAILTVDVITNLILRRHGLLLIHNL
jgi:hypothetical protein